MTVVVGIKRHLLSETLDVTKDSEIWVVGFACVSQLVCLFDVSFDNLMNLEDARIVIENTTQKPKSRNIYFLKS